MSVDYRPQNMKNHFSSFQAILAWPFLLFAASGSIGFGQSDSRWQQQTANPNAVPFASQGAATNAKSSNPFVRIVKHNDGSRTITAKSQKLEGQKQSMQEVKTVDKDGNLRLRRIYYLNRYGQPQRFEMYDGTGRPVLTGEFEYDGLDRIRKEVLFEVGTGMKLREQTRHYRQSHEAPLIETKSYGVLPVELLYWMDPDQENPWEGTGASPAPSTEKKQGDDRSLLQKLNPFSRKK